MKKYLFLLPLFFSFFVVNNTFAVSDITYTLSSSLLQQEFCSSTACDGYKYVVIDSSSFVKASNFQLRYTYIDTNSTTYNQSIIPAFLDDTLVLNVPAISFNSIKFAITSFNNLPSDYTFTVTLTENNPFETECPEPEEPEPCPECSNLTYHDDFEGVKVAIYTCGAILIVLYFFYCIYRMIIKGTGAN